MNVYTLRGVPLGSWGSGGPDLLQGSTKDSGREGVPQPWSGRVGGSCCIGVFVL